MKSCRWMLVVVVVAGLLAGCGAPKIDSSSPETYAKSHEKMRRALSPAEQARLELALKVFFNAELDKRYEAGGLMAVAADAEGIGLALQARLDGLTAQEIFAEAERLQAAAAAARSVKLRQRLTAAQAELAKLEAKLAADEAQVAGAQALCAKVAVLPIEWWTGDPQGGRQNVLETTVRNDTGQALVGLAVEIRLQVAGREAPLLLTKMGQPLPQGLAPGAQTKLLWQNDEIRKLTLPALPADKLVTTVTVCGLTGADGKAVVPLSEWTKLDGIRLRQARDEVAAQEAELAKLGEAAK